MVSKIGAKILTTRYIQLIQININDILMIINNNKWYCNNKW